MQVIKATLDKSSGISRIKLENVTYGKTEFIPYFNSGNLFRQICNYLLNKGLQIEKVRMNSNGDYILIAYNV